MLKSHQSGKKLLRPKLQNLTKISKLTLFSSLHLPHSPGTTEKATFAHFMKKAMNLKSGFLSDYKVLLLLPNESNIKVLTTDL